MQRLGIVIPYRDRAQHLAKLLPHLALYFSRDKRDKAIPVTVTVVEPPPGLPFNRGLICNIGFQLVRARADYVCFHDVDYLPIWADYSYPDLPTMIVWYGMEKRPIDPARPEAGAINNRLDIAFSAVVLLRNEHFVAANGFSNDYWGWGREDIDLKNRLVAAGISTRHRRGTFHPLDHPHAGYAADRTLRPEVQRNRDLFDRRWPKPADSWRAEGLNTAAFDLAKLEKLTIPAEREIVMEHAFVTFPHRPEHEERRADDAGSAAGPANVPR